MLLLLRLEGTRRERELILRLLLLVMMSRLGGAAEAQLRLQRCGELRWGELHVVLPVDLHEACAVRERQEPARADADRLGIRLERNEHRLPAVRLNARLVGRGVV